MQIDMIYYRLPLNPGTTPVGVTYHASYPITHPIPMFFFQGATYLVVCIKQDRQMFLLNAEVAFISHLQGRMKTCLMQISAARQGGGTEAEVRITTLTICITNC